MIGGMMVDVQKGFVPMKQETTTKSNYEKSRKIIAESSKLSINERYRRLIPYMTFYYANDLSSTTEAYHAKNIEVEKAEIVEQKLLEQQQQNQRQPKKIVYSPHRNIPRYQGNRLTHFNIASANPTKVYYKEVPVYQNSPKVSPNYNPLSSGYVISNDDYDQGRFVHKPIVKSPSVPFTTTTRKPYLNLYNDESSGGVQYYLADKEQPPKYKLVPYEQTPPVKVPQNDNVYVTKKPFPVPVLIQKEPVYIKQRPARPQYVYDNVNVQQLVPRKQPVVVSESYYDNRRPPVTLSQPIAQPVVESGFKPIVSPVVTTQAPIYTTELSPSPIPQYETEKPTPIEAAPVTPESGYRPNYYQYVVDQPTYNQEPYEPSNSVTLSDLLNSLQLNKSIPKPITRENVGSSIRTLLQVLNALKAMQQNEIETPVLSTPKPFVAVEPVDVTPKQQIEATPVPAIDDADLHEEPYLAHVNTPSQHLDDFSSPGSTSQRFPQPVHSDEEGGTPGRPGVDYPILTTIPSTSFDCKTQRYKGFFADPETRCQVWHYCDLNGGQASFLCPNGTIFSQAGLTCDWWFNVRCAATPQLYVLNESLYKYILPHSPKFPEDYSGPLVDKYLTLKFKEMEEQFKKNKNKGANEKMDSEESSEDSTEKELETTSQKSEEISDDDLGNVSEANVHVGSPGTSGNVERLQD
ncbi:uncharacterized protein LOC126370048 isoform X2 [Pectinophora gossypiella]|nr:uncharacterized protein LOC126370048 isoform X2 [Pectinophora gossypiella]